MNNWTAPGSDSGVVWGPQTTVVPMLLVRRQHSRTASRYIFMPFMSLFENKNNCIQESNVLDGILGMQRNILTGVQYAKDYNQILMEYSHSHSTQQTKKRERSFKREEILLVQLQILHCE